MSANRINRLFGLPSKKKTNNPIYTSVRSGDESVDTSSEGEAFLPDEKPVLRSHRQFSASFYRIGLEIAILVASSIALGFSISNRWGTSLHQRQLECGRLLGQWLPDAEAGVEYEVRRFVGSFYAKSPYTGIGPEVDAAWDNITDGGAIGITKEQWEAVNSVGEYPVLLDKDHGTGQYLASIDVFHQLHCVNLLRKALHREYYNKHEGSFAGAPEAIVQGHLEHCVENLRQTLMCHGDMTLLTYNWIEGREMPYPNFNTVHMCKKWDTLARWNLNRDITYEELEDGTGKKLLTPPLKPKQLKGLSTPP